MAEAGKTRLTNWDLLRSLSMLAVFFVHSHAFLDPVFGPRLGGMIARAAIICDPVFFALSGYFAIRIVKEPLSAYYRKKFCAIVLPLFVFALLLYPISADFTGLNIFGFVKFFATQLIDPWWFIPTLIPYLIIAPFLGVFFEALSDKASRWILFALLGFSAWAAVSLGLGWLFNVGGNETCSAAVTVATKIVPVLPVSNTYLMYFCAGYFFRRCLPALSGKVRVGLVLAGIASFAYDLLAKFYHIDLVDPSYQWLLATCAIFILFERMRISNDLLNRAVQWTAKRSYSIYLLNMLAINTVFPFINNMVLAGSYPELSPCPAFAIWVAEVLLSYALSLAYATLIDCTVLKGIQFVFNKATDRFVRRPLVKLAR